MQKQWGQPPDGWIRKGKKLEETGRSANDCNKKVKFQAHETDKG
jgi:hypothetical protein